MIILQFDVLRDSFKIEKKITEYPLKVPNLIKILNLERKTY